MPEPGLAHQRTRLGVRRHHRLRQFVERLVVAAAHDRQLAVLRTSLPARHRSIDEADPELGGRLGQLVGNLCRRCGVVDEHGPGLGAGQHSVGSVDHLAHVVVVADAHHHELGALGSLSWSRRRTVAVERDPCQRLLRECGCRR